MDLSEQLQSKADLFQDIDDKILAATDDEDKIEEAVFESADIQASLSAKIVLIMHTFGDEFVSADITCNSHTHGRGEQHSSTQQFPNQHWHEWQPGNTAEYRSRGW